MLNIESIFGAGITERDMDLIFLEEFASSEEFCRIFFNKIGIEETREILKNYLSRPDRNLNTLYRYAAQLNCAKILNTYLEVLL